ncbi:unnamed protein product [Didymodactylos carnosus]|uniref:Peptidase A2 domain-containing protein n=1 Tax=Didymodactylos carnosus TaxID=1234261 RepID=A0A8S2EU56_9BILA|nr:unnamed protein product [Didymodactylos carnosus]CAF4117639.1 unnamed protein product [Didymodactylos carnosus]
MINRIYQPSDNTTLHVAVCHGHNEIVELLLQTGACRSMKDKYSLTPFEEDHPKSIFVWVDINLRNLRSPPSVAPITLRAKADTGAKTLVLNTEHCKKLNLACLGKGTYNDIELAYEKYSGVQIECYGKSATITVHGVIGLQNSSLGITALRSMQAFIDIIGMRLIF